MPPLEPIDWVGLALAAFAFYSLMYGIVQFILWLEDNQIGGPEW